MRNAVGMPQSVAVFGGGSDIALATVRRLIERGCTRILLAARRPDDLADLAAALKEDGADAVELLPFDADDFASHDEVVGEVFDRLGEVDMVLLAFGVLGDQDDFDRDPDAAVAAIETNYTGTVSVAMRVAGRLRRQGHGLVVVLSSVAGERVRKANFVYGSTKAGLDGFSQGLGDALQGSGVDVMVVRPGFVHSKMTEGMEAAPFSTTPDRVADDIIKGLERGAHTVWSPGLLRAVMAVMRHLPRVVWRRMPG
jgi:decaprenylphospho-beta-D-erythro-pentofuranosid-2-ulose 2-reductase